MLMCALLLMSVFITGTVIQSLLLTVSFCKIVSHLRLYLYKCSAVTCYHNCVCASWCYVCSTASADQYQDLICNYWYHLLFCFVISGIQFYLLKWMLSMLNLNSCLSWC